MSTIKSQSTDKLVYSPGVTMRISKEPPDFRLDIEF